MLLGAFLLDDAFLLDVFLLDVLLLGVFLLGVFLLDDVFCSADRVFVAVPDAARFFAAARFLAGDFFAALAAGRLVTISPRVPTGSTPSPP